MADIYYVPPSPHLDTLDRAEWGNLMWAQLHARPFERNGDFTDEIFWLTNFRDHIPCPDCRRHFIEHMEAHPPDFSSPQMYRLWIWWAHNLVNRRIGKPLLAWQLKTWGEPPVRLKPELIDPQE